MGPACGGGSGSEQESPVRILSFGAQPAHLDEPGEVTIAWETKGATSISLVRGDETLQLGDASPARGSVAVQVDRTTTFELIAQGRGGPVKAQATVELPPPVIGTFSAPEVVGLDESGAAAARLSWTGVAGATALFIDSDTLPRIDLAAGESADGSIEVEVREDTTFTLVASNEDGEARESAAVRVVALPTIESLRSDRERVGTGEEASISWVTTGAAGVELFLDGVRFDPPEPLPTTGATSLAIHLAGTIELRAFNEVGAEARQSLAIDVGSPEILELTTSSNLLWLGESITLAWETLGGAALTISADGIEEPICAEGDPARIAASSCEWQPPAAGDWVLSVDLVNASGVAGETIELGVRTGPAIRLFTVQPQTLVLGEPVTIAWAALPDPAGNAPTLRLQDGRGNTQSLASTEGSFALTPDQAGSWVFTLHAETDDERSLPAQAAAPVEVLPAPIVTLVAAPENFDDSVDDDVVLAWTSTDVDELVLYRLVGGEPIELAVIPPDERPTGSLRVVPTADTTYRLVGTGALGSEAISQRSVTVAPTEVLTFTAEPGAITAGQPVRLEWTTRSADEVSLDIAEQPYLIEETTDAYLDVAAMGGVPLPLTADCGPIDTQGCAVLSFPTDFSFRFGDIDYASLRVYGNGVISFDDRTLAPFSGMHAGFPSTELAWAHLAPFWTELGWSSPADPRPAGDLHVLRIDDGTTDAIVIQWKDVKFNFQAFRDSSLNFEVVLHADGTFQYRYGEMFPGSAPPSMANGENATIGFQLPDQSESDLRSFNGQVRPLGTIAHRSFAYRPAPPVEKNGSLVWYPYTNQETVSATLKVRRGEVVNSKQITVDVARRPELVLVPRAIQPTPAGEEFRIGWTTTAATAVELVDEEDRVRCQATSALEVASGYCTVVELSQANYTYRLRATGAHGYVAEREVRVPVYEEPFGIVFFEVDRPVVLSGESLTLSWDADRAASVSLLADGIELLPNGAPTGPGSLTLGSIAKKTSFTLRVTNSIGMTDERTIEVPLWSVSIEATPSVQASRPGELLTITVDSAALDGGPAPVIFGSLPLEEVTDPASRFSDISGVSGVKTLTVGTTTSTSINNIDLPEGFTFPFFGEDQRFVRTFLDGYVSFTPNAAVQPTNQILPVASTNAGLRAVHLAPFWDSMNPRGVSKMYAALVDADTYVIQWSKMNTNVGTNNTARVDMNFQLVLKRSGVFEYRYGTMQPHTNPPTSGAFCKPSTCENEVNGSSATIGYQRIGATNGWTHHYGDGNTLNVPYAGGLANRTFRYEPFTGRKTLSYYPTQSGVFEFCARSGSDVVCRNVDVSVEFGIDSFRSSAESISFGQSATLSWKSRGANRLTIRAGDAVVYTTDDLATVDEGSLVVDPKQHTTYTLEIEGASKRATASTRVEVQRIQLTASATPSTYPGQPVTLSWNLANADPLAQPMVVNPMEEIFSQPFSAFDLSTDADATELVPANNGGKNTVVNFTQGFTFSYFGKEYGSMVVSSEGYLNFETSNVSVLGNNTRLPTSSFIQIAPFWENLHTRVSGRVFAKQFDANTYVVQWSRTSVDTGSSNASAYNLNFMVILRRGGVFEFRYGDMQQPPQPSPLCNPESCRDEANGSSATIGYQTVGGTASMTLHYGGTGNETGRLPMAGGLSNRSWKFTPGAATGSVQLTPGETTVYRICAVDPASGDVFCAAPVEVEVRWGIDSFEPTPAAPAAGEQLSLRWKVHGLDELVVTANGSAIASYTGGNIPAIGEVSHKPMVDTTYELIGRSMGREVRESRRVGLRTFALTVQAPTPVRYLPGSKVDLGWSVTQPSSGNLFVAAPMGEIEGSPFLDVSKLPGAAEVELEYYSAGETIVFPAGFTFPYFGRQTAEATVYAGGYLSFAPVFGASHAENKWLPVLDDETKQLIHLAPFWDSLIWEGPAKIWTYQLDPDSFVIQWSHFDRTLSSTNEGDRYDLNFQVVLFRDGSFEYRYGTMKPPISPPDYVSDRCMPSSCVREANGAGATIGYQTEDGAYGYTMHYGGIELDPWSNGTVPGLQEFQGGLSNRSFRFSPAKSGTAKLTVGRGREHRICAFGDTFSECKSVRIDAVADPGELMITEAMIRPTGGLNRQWFEVRNLSHRTIDLQGFQIRTSSGSHTIDQPLPIAPGAFRVFAPSASSGVTADHLYGSDISLSSIADRLEIVSGTAAIASFHWGVEWSIPVSRSLSLDPSFQRLGVETLDDPRMWCATASVTPGSQGVGCLNPWYDVDPTSQRPFIEIAAIGSRLHELEGSATLGALPMDGFSFPFFGERFDKVWIGSMGWLSLSETTPTSSPGLGVPPLPRSAGLAMAGPLVSGFWNNLACDRRLFDCKILQWRGAVDGQEVQIIQWEGFQIRTLTQNAKTWIHTGTLTFQAQLWQSGEVVIAFDVVQPFAPEHSADWISYMGSAAWIGIEARDRTNFVSGHYKNVLDLQGRSFLFQPK